MDYITADNPPNLHALDWWGQIGGKLHPTTLQPIAGVIYDCNQHGHTIRPYVPPRLAAANITYTFFNSDFPEPVRVLVYSGKVTITEYTFSILLSGNASGYVGTLSSQNWQTPDDGSYAANLYHDGALIRSYLIEHIDLYAPHILPAVPPLTGAHCWVRGDFRDPIDPTAAQIAQRAHHRDMLDTWAALTAAQRAAWSHYSRRYATTGITAFLKRNAEQARHGLPALATPD